MIDTVILAGTNKKNLIYGKNKFLLGMNGQIIGQHIIKTCLESKTIDEIVVVGPKGTEEAVGIIDHKVHYVDEKHRFLQNSLIGYDMLRQIKKDLGEETSDDMPVLFVTSDIPFVTSDSIDYFVEKSLKQDHSINICHVPEKELRVFYPFLDKPMIPTKEGNYKEGNIIIVRPEEVPYKDRIEDSYTLRRQMKIYNNILLIGKIIRLGGVDTALRLTAMLTKRYYRKMASHFVKPDENGRYGALENLIPDVSQENMEKSLTKLMGCSVKIIDTPYPELCIDIDSEREYDVFKENYTKFKMLVDLKTKRCSV